MRGVLMSSIALALALALSAPAPARAEGRLGVALMHGKGATAGPRSPI